MKSESFRQRRRARRAVRKQFGRDARKPLNQIGAPSISVDLPASGSG